jgi:hypothetical protein
MNKVTKNRSTLKKNPAYLEYPSDNLNNEIFKSLDMIQRGLCWTLRMYCWVNGSVPSSFKELSVLVGIKETLLLKAFEDGKLYEFFQHNDDSTRLYSPDLEAYRDELLRKQKKRQEDGEVNAEKRWRKESGNAISDEMGSEMKGNDYVLGGSMNGYLNRLM